MPAPALSAAFIMCVGRPGTLIQPAVPSNAVTESPTGKCIVDMRLFGAFATMSIAKVLIAEAARRALLHAARDFVDRSRAAGRRQIFLEDRVGRGQRRSIRLFVVIVIAHCGGFSPSTATSGMPTGCAAP